MTILDFLRAWTFLPSVEGKQVFASGSEKRRWLDRGSVEIDGERAQMGDPWPLPDISVVIHPKSNSKRTTLQ